jgi:preprotein translocase subunit YajC
MQNRITENQARINELARVIDELSTELSELLQIEDNNLGRDIEEIRREIRVGDTVEVTNNYRNQLGEQGTVTRVTDKQVTVRLDSTGRTIRKKKTNVRIVPSNEDRVTEQ